MILTNSAMLTTQMCNASMARFLTWYGDTKFEVLKEGRTLDDFVPRTPHAMRRRPYVDETGDYGRRR
jgi:hypothetical protein